ncbi:hypothetical protein DFJ73DRAFT_801175 [Zopfochytrium polystomum]|nr:hypothetical protein DFJ73DRAFT_801175 [Zopfochytrium polystomum]
MVEATREALRRRADATTTLFSRLSHWTLAFCVTRRARRLARAVKGSRLRLLGMKSTDPSPQTLGEPSYLSLLEHRTRNLDVLEVNLTEIAATSRQPFSTRSHGGTGHRTAQLLLSIPELLSTWSTSDTTDDNFRLLWPYAPRVAAPTFSPPLLLPAARILPHSRNPLAPTAPPSHLAAAPGGRRCFPRLVLDCTMSASFETRDAAAVLAALSDRASIGFLDASSARSISPER